MVYYSRQNGFIQKGRLFMDAVHGLEGQESSYVLEDAMEVLMWELDGAIEDQRSGRVISEEELWEEIDAI